MQQLNVRQPRRAVAAVPIPPSFPKRAFDYRPQGDNDMVRELGRLGVNATLSRTLNSNDHKISAALRATLTAYAYGHFFENTHFTVQSIYGSPRDISIANYLNSRAIDQNDSIIVNLHRPLLVAQDTTRIRAQVRDTPFDANAAIFLVDVYETQMGPLSPAVIMDWVSNLHPDVPRLNCVQWLGHVFKGDAGVVNNEGGWIRKDNKILFRSDIRSQTYAPHDPCDWLWKTSSYRDARGTLVWAERKHLGDMVLYTFSVVTTDVYVTPEPSVIKEFEYIDVPYLETSASPLVAFIQQKCLNYVPFGVLDLFSLLGKKKMLVHRKTFLDCYNESAHRSFTPLSKQVLVQKVKQLFSDCQSYQLLLKLFPNELDFDVFSLSLAVMNYRLYDKTLSLQCDNALNSALREQFNEAAAGGYPSTNSWRVKILVTAVLLLIILFLRRRRSVPANFSPLLNKLFVCFGAPIIEEWLKRKVPGMNAALPVVEFVLNIMSYSVGDAMRPLIIHFICNCLPMKWAIILHSLWNIFATCCPAQRKVPEATLLSYADFRQHFYFSEWSTRKILEPLKTCSESFDLSLSLTPRQIAFSSQPEKDDILVLQGQIPLVEGNISNPYFQILPTNVPGYAPAKVDLNLYHAVNLRILAKPPLAPRIQENNWRDVEFYPIDDEDEIEYTETLLPWLDHFEGKKKKKYLTQAQQMQQTGFAALEKYVKRTELFVKTDELLLKIKNDMMVMKPRIIANIHPSVQVYVGPYIYEAQQRLKRQWSYTSPPKFIFKPWECTRRFFLTYACDATDKKLSDWLQHKLVSLGEDDVAIIVSGDDSLVLTKREGRMRIYEGDASMYDQSQSFGPLRYQYDVLERLGVPVEVTNILADLAGNNYVLHTRDPTYHGIINKKNRPIRDTGGTDTSIGNSLIMAVAWIFVASKDFDTSWFDYLGFEMKLRVFDNIEEATFLKGRWYTLDASSMDQYHYFWAPLPSRVLKIGKAMVDPRVIYKTKDLIKGARLFLSDVAHSYSAFMAVPILRVFIRNFKIGEKMFDQIPEYAVHGEACHFKIDEVENMYWLCKHYDVPPLLWEEVEDMFPSQPFVYMESPLFTSLARKDYG
jgi:hypothetical protein